MERETDQSNDDGVLIQRKLQAYFHAYEGSYDDEQLQEQRRILEALTNVELARIAARRRLKETSVFQRIAGELDLPIEKIAYAVGRLKFHWREGCTAMPRTRTPPLAYCSICNDKVALEEGNRCRSLPFVPTTIMTAFSMLVRQVERDFGVSIPVSPSTDLAAVPHPLRPLYEFSDGLTLPFATIHKIADWDRTTFPGWIYFGSDHYFSWFLCHESESPALTSWDHEVGHEIEAEFDTAIEWLTEEYETFIEADTGENVVHITAIPESVSKTEAIAEIKRISNKSTSQLLADLRTGDFAVSNVIRSRAFSTVRNLAALGVACHLECDT